MSNGRPGPFGSLAERRAALVQRLLEIEPAARHDPQAVRVVRAPGRVNLIGEHTDYNMGFVMPAAISLETWIASAPIDQREVRLTSLEQAERRAFDLDEPGEPRDEWIDYVAGVAWALNEQQLPLRGLAGVVETTIPIGSGLSSSAALELAAAWTLSRDLPPPLAPMALAQAAQRAENGYVGVRSGLMDQFAAALGEPDVALLLDCRSLEYRPVALPAGHVLVALDTRSPHRLDASAYNDRRAQCERAVAALSARYPAVTSLRDVTAEMLAELPALVDEETVRRCRHVVAENERVLQTVAALEAGDMLGVGRLFAQSHASLRDLYEVSSAELDALVEIASEVAGVAAARMTGAGFGGCTVNIVELGAVDELRSAVANGYPRRTGRTAGVHVLEAVAGAGVVEAS